MFTISHDGIKRVIIGCVRVLRRMRSHTSSSPLYEDAMVGVRRVDTMENLLTPDFPVDCRTRATLHGGTVIGEDRLSVKSTNWRRNLEVADCHAGSLHQLFEWRLERQTVFRHHVINISWRKVRGGDGSTGRITDLLDERRSVLDWHDRLTLESAQRDAEHAHFFRKLSHGLSRAQLLGQAMRRMLRRIKMMVPTFRRVVLEGTLVVAARANTHLFTLCHDLLVLELGTVRWLQQALTSEGVAGCSNDGANQQSGGGVLISVVQAPEIMRDPAACTSVLSNTSFALNGDFAELKQALGRPTASLRLP